MKLNATKAAAILGLFGSLTGACGGATETPTPEGVIGTPGRTDGPPAELPPQGPAMQPSESREPSQTKPTALSCAQLQVDTKPAGQLQLEELKGGYGLVPVDVHVTERLLDNVRTLSIVLGDTPHECAYASSASSAQKLNELRLVLRRTSTTTPDAFQLGTYDTVGGADLTMQSEAGERCVPAGEVRNGGGGTAVSGGPATGIVTLTARTATTLEGTFDVTSSEGRLKGTFKSPICAPLVSAAKAVCCKAE